MSILSGLDWSGSPGDPRRTPGCNPRFVIVAAHVRVADVANLDGALAALRGTLRLPPNYFFKHQGAADRTRREFFSTVQGVPFTAHARVVDKMADLDIGYFARTTGPEQITEAIVGLVCGCPDRLVADQTLLIDLPRSELPFIRELRTALRRALRGNARRSFQKVTPCPDHRVDGSIVQLADMIAGEIHERGRITGPYLDLVMQMIEVV